MNGAGGIWTVLLVALAGLGAWLIALGWPFLQTLSPESPSGQLLAIADSLLDADDFDARVVLKGEGEEEVELRVRYVAHPAIRIDLLRPEEMAGEVYTLREGEEGWLLVHYKPHHRGSVGVRSSMPAPDWLGAALDVGQLRRALQLGRLSVGSPEEGILEVRGLPGPVPKLVLRRGSDDEALPISWVEVYPQDRPGGTDPLRIRFVELELDQGIEFRDLLSLPEWPRRWFEG